MVKTGVALEAGSPTIEGYTLYENDVAPGPFILRAIVLSVIEVAVRIGAVGYVRRVSTFDAADPPALIAVICIVNSCPGTRFFTIIIVFVCSDG